MCRVKCGTLWSGKYEYKHFITYRMKKEHPFIIVDLNSGRYVKEHSVGHEKYNLEPNKIDGLYYGYCPPYGGIGIERLGAKRKELSVNNVIVFYSRKKGKGPDREIIAFTDKATVFRKEQSGKGMMRQIVIDGKTIDCGYHIVSENIYILKRASDRFQIHCGDYNTHMFRKQRAFSDKYRELDKLLLAWFNEYLLRMNQDDSLYQEQLEDLIPVYDTDSSSTREPEYLDSKTGRVAKKNPSISSKAVAASGFKCSYDPTHHTFRKANGIQYMEGHHLIPCNSGNSEKYWKRFGRNIDCFENIVSLCPTCHRRIHYGSEAERNEIIDKLYKVQAKRLKVAGLEISLDELRKLYGCR
jgi:5-methylcytosine-specific restriction protein A